QEIVRISDGLAQRDPQNPNHLMNNIDASINIAYIHQNAKRETEAAGVYDKLIKESDPIMRLHSTSDDLLNKLLYAHQRRGEMSFKVQQYDTARDVYRRGVDLFSRCRDAVKSPGEQTQYNYLQCCRGLLEVAKEKKETTAAIDVATRLIVPFKLETFTDGDR